MPSVAVLNCRQIVAPRGGEIAVLAHGGLFAKDGLIVSVGETSSFASQMDSETVVIDAQGQVMLPGFVDAHTHLVFGSNRADEFAQRAAGVTYQQIAESGGGILSSVRAVRAASEGELFDAAKRRAVQMLTMGTTTAEVKSGYGLTLADELKMLRVIQRIGSETPLQTTATLLAAHAIPPEFRDNPSGYVELIVDQILPLVVEKKRADACDIFVEDRYFTPDHARRVLGEAKRLGLKTKIHADQMRDGGGALLAAELRTTTADHLEHTPSTAFPALREASVIPVLLPASVFCLGLSKYPDARGMIEAGLRVVLATDFNPGSSPTFSIPFAMSLAMLQMKMTPEEALAGVTINAASSLGLADQIGSLEIGKRANFSLWPVDDWREIPYWVGVARPSRVFVAGEEIGVAG